MTVDFSPIANALVSLAAIVVTTAAPILIAAMLRRFKWANNADLEKSLDAAANAAAGAAYKFAAERINDGGLKNVAIHNAALAMGAQYVASHMPETLTQLGLSPDQVRAMVEARLGKLMATDPSVTAGSPTVDVPTPTTPAAPVAAP